MTFYEYIEQELRKPPSVDWYDPNGASSRAVMTRMRRKGIMHSVWWECRQVIGEVKYFITDGFDGWDTPISWFCQLITTPFALPIAPFWGAYWRYQRALSDYKSEYRIKHYLDPL